MKIAITGGAGFLGNAVARKLKSQHLTYTLLDPKKHNLVRAASLKDFVKGEDVIIHLAAVNRGENTDLFGTNVLGTLSLLEAAVRYAPNAKIIFSSSFQVYLKDSFFGLSKKMAEDLIIKYSKSSKVKGIIFRISNIYGSGGKPFYNSVIATFAHLVKTNQPITVNGDGSQKRDFIYVDDVAEAIVKAVYHTPKKSLEIMDICSGRQVTLKRVLKILKDLSGKNFEILYNKAAKEKPWPTGNKNYKRAKKLLNWTPTTSLEQGLAVVMKWKLKLKN